MYTDIRLKLIHFFRKNKKIIGIAFLIWLVIFIINQMMKTYKPAEVPEITYTPHKSVINTASSTPNFMREQIEKMIEEYVEHCNNGDYQKAYGMLSEDCRKYSFNNDIVEFSKHVLNKMPVRKQYSIQNYSNTGGVYTYQIKYTDNFLATGITNQKYSYTEEKMSFKSLNDGTISMATGNYIRQANVQSVLENEHIKIDIIDKVVFYSMERYIIKLTNRSDYIVVIADRMEPNEIMIGIPDEFRSRINVDTDVVLQPKQSIDVTWEFRKFSDDGKNSENITLGAIRVMENYSGNEVEDDVAKREIENAISKFSMQIPIVEK